MEDTALAAELDRLQAMARELEARVDSHDGPAAARELCGALAASVDRAIRLAGSNGNAGPSKNNGAQLRTSRKSTAGVAKVRKQVRVASVKDTAPLEDGLSWRKYGQKDILGAPYPRAYFRCTHRHTRGCHATKQVQRAAADPLFFDVVYLGAHTCAQAPAVSLLSAVQQQPPVSGQEQGSPAATQEGVHWWPAEPVTPFSFPSSPAGAIDGCYLQPISGYGYGYGYAVTDGFGVDMEYEPQLDELFFDPSDLFQSEIQTLY